MAIVKPKSDHPPSGTIGPLVARLRLRHFLLLEALVEMGSLRAAARRLDLPQPMVGTMLRELEHALGATLFNRSPQGVEASVMAAHFAERAAVAIEALKAALVDLSATAYPTIRVGIVTLAMTAHGPTWLAKMRQKAPEFRIEVHVGPASDLLDRLLKGEIDCAVARVPMAEMADRIHERCHIWPLPADACHVVGRSGHRAARRRSPLEPHEIADFDWVLPAQGSQLRKRFNEACALAGVAIPHPIITVDAIQSCALVAAQTDCLTLCSEHLLTHAVFGRNLRIVHTNLQIHEPPLALLQLKETARSQAIASFRNIVVT